MADSQIALVITVTGLTFSNLACVACLTTLASRMQRHGHEPARPPGSDGHAAAARPGVIYDPDATLELPPKNQLGQFMSPKRAAQLAGGKDGPP